MRSSTRQTPWRALGGEQIASELMNSQRAPQKPSRPFHLRFESRWFTWSLLLWLTCITVLIGCRGIDRILSLWLAIGFLPSATIYTWHRMTRVRFSTAFGVLLCLSAILPLSLFQALPLLMSMQDSARFTVADALTPAPLFAWFGLSWAVVYSMWNFGVMLVIHALWSQVVLFVRHRRQADRNARFK
jgi:hypothetical protein